MVGQVFGERIRAIGVIDDARRTIKMAELRCIPFDRLIERLYELASDSQSSDIVYAIEESDRTKEQNHTLAIALRVVLRKVDRTQGIDRGRMDRQIGRLLRILPTDLSEPIAVECVSHKRKSRRTAGLKCLNFDSMDEDTFRYFINCFDKTGDDRILKVLLKHPIWPSCVEPTRLLAAFEKDQYWQMRVVEATLRKDQEIGLSLAATHPAEFVWAAGRIRDTTLLPAISHCFEAANDKLGLVGIVAWAYARLEAYAELRALHSVLAELEQQYDLDSERI